jgi:hypothetical protein
MRIRRRFVCCSVLIIVGLARVPDARAQAQTQSTASRIVLDFGIGVDNSVNGNVNSGAIGRLQGLATAMLPQPYGEVYGTGIQFRFGGGWVLDDVSEVRGVFIYQSADADLVRLGDIGPSSLYAQYSDYKSLALDVGYRRYVPMPHPNLRVFGEATLGLAFIDRINALFAAPQSNAVFNETDLYDSSAAFTWSVGGGVMFKVASQLDVTAQLGLRHVGPLAEVDQFVGTGLEDFNNDSSRLTFPIVVGVRVRFK